MSAQATKASARNKIAAITATDFFVVTGSKNRRFYHNNRAGGELNISLARRSKPIHVSAHGPPVRHAAAGTLSEVMTPID